MDLEGFSGYLRRLEFPIPLRFGGFSPAATNPYDSRSPFERSFTIRPDGLIVAIGWPLFDGVIQPTLFNFRLVLRLFRSFTNIIAQKRTVTMTPSSCWGPSRRSLGATKTSQGPAPKNSSMRSRKPKGKSAKSFEILRSKLC